MLNRARNLLKAFLGILIAFEGVLVIRILLDPFYPTIDVLADEILISGTLGIWVAVSWNFYQWKKQQPFLVMAVVAVVAFGLCLYVDSRIDGLMVAAADLVSFSLGWIMFLLICPLINDLLGLKSG